MRTKKLLSSPSNKQDDMARVNPEFLGIGKEFVHTHLERRSIELIKKKKSNQVSFLEKEHELAQKKLQKKQQDLQRLKQVIARKEADDNQRERLRQKRQAEIAQQRQQNMRRRHYHQEQLRNAYLSLYEDNKDASQNMRKTFNMYESLRQSMKLEDQRKKKELVMSVSMDKGEGRKKVDNFYKSRNDIFTDNYKQKIRYEKEVANNASTTINNLNAVQNQLKMKLQESNSKINQIHSAYIQTCQNRLRSNKSFLSGASRSRLKQIRKSFSIEMKDEKQPQIDQINIQDMQNA